MRWEYLLAAIVALVLLTASPEAAAMITDRRPLGIRNNNPGNIRYTGDQWDGLVSVDSRGFCVFATPEDGIRALAKLLNNYRTWYGLNTVRAIVSRWAPPVENDTESYIRSVAGRMGVNENQPLTDADMPKLVQAIIWHENGQQPYTVAQIDTGIERAMA